MILKKIELFNFRNYNYLKVILNPKINVFIGKNGMGKTNILESIYFLAITKSYRTNFDNRMIKEKETITKVKGVLLKENKLSSNLEMQIINDVKKAIIDKTEIKKLGDYISNLNVIIFSPESIELIKGSPNIRRRFLNIEITQIDKKYLKQLSNYNELLKIRNGYLKLIKDNKKIDKLYFDVITDKLIENAIYLYQKRNDYIKEINKYLEKIYLEIAEKGKLRIKYINNIDSYEDIKIKEYLNQKYKNSYKSEIEQGKTLYGPHRDDFLFVLDDKDIKNYGSQGQQRMAILSLKLSEIEIFKNITNEDPILLLDDIFSELDKFKKKKFIEYISKKTQTIITTTDINKKSLNNATIFTVKDEKISKIEEVN